MAFAIITYKPRSNRIWSIITDKRITINILFNNNLKIYIMINPNLTQFEIALIIVLMPILIIGICNFIWNISLKH